MRVELFRIRGETGRRIMDLGVAQFVTKPAGLDQFLEIGKLIKDLLAGDTAA